MDYKLAIAEALSPAAGMPAGELAKEFEAQGIRAYAFAHVKDALEEARRLAGPEGNVVCAGSLYLIGEMRTVLREERDKR